MAVTSRSLAWLGPGMPAPGVPGALGMTTAPACHRCQRLLAVAADVSLNEIVGMAMHASKCIACLAMLSCAAVDKSTNIVSCSGDCMVLSLHAGHMSRCSPAHR